MEQGTPYSQKLFETLFEFCPDAVLVTDAQGRILGGNAELERLFGYSRTELLGQPVEILLPERFRKSHPAHRKEYTDQPRLRPMGSELELFARRKDGSEFPVDIMLGPVETDQGRVTLSVVRDTSEQKSTEQVLRQREQQLDLLAEIVKHHEELQAAQQQLVREHDRLQLLLEINNAVASKLDLRELFAAISSCLRPLTRHDYSEIVLHDRETGELRIRGLDFPQGKGLLREEQVVPVENTPAGTVYRTRRPLLVERLEKERFPSATTDRLLGEGVRSMCLVPLIVHDRMLGVLSIGSSQEAAFSPADLELKTMVAKQIAIAVDNALAYEQVAKMKERLEQENLYLEEEVRSEAGFEDFIGESAVLKDVLRQVETVAPTNSSVLIMGETGTGKELIARAIHQRGARSERAFIKLNCAAIPTGLLESELFGHEKGAFTGAIARKMGRLQLAHQGTLFLDEIGDIALELQPKLLRVLQEGEFEPLGSNKTHRVDVRLVAATNRELTEMVDARQFRSDLYYRLNVFPIRVPPLRERAQDIPLLVRYFAQKYARQMNKKIMRIPATSLKVLARWSWPGNIRELQNLVERAVILSREDVLELPITELEPGPRASGAPDDTLEAAEREHIIRVLRESNGVIGGPQGAATKLGLKRTTLNAKMRKLGISRDDTMLAE